MRTDVEMNEISADEVIAAIDQRIESILPGIQSANTELENAHASYRRLGVRAAHGEPVTDLEWEAAENLVDRLNRQLCRFRCIVAALGADAVALGKVVAIAETDCPGQG
jgi:hypothetical protein